MNRFDLPSIFFTGCWNLVLYPCFGAPQLDHDAPESLSLSVFCLVPIGFLVVQL